MKKPFVETAKILIDSGKEEKRSARFPTLALPRSGVRVLSQSSHLSRQVGIGSGEHP